MLTRADILVALRDALEPLPYVNAMWEGGAAAFNRVDQWSDIDLQLDVDDGRVQDAVGALEHALQRISSIDVRYEIPRPTWHGHWQAFYRLHDAGPYLLLDLTVMEHSAANRFSEPETHGTAVVHFDRAGVVRQDPHDPDLLGRRIADRLAQMRASFDLFQVLTLKELNRGNTIEALAFYNGHTLRPLVEALRILHSPARHGFHTRYIHYDIPPHDLERLQRLAFVADAHALRLAWKEAGEWFRETVARIDERGTYAAWNPA